MGSDVGFVMCCAGESPVSGSAIPVTREMVFEAANEAMGAADLAVLHVPNFQPLADAAAVTFCAFWVSSDVSRGTLACDLSMFAKRISARARSRTMATFVAEHYAMSGYRIFDRGAHDAEAFCWLAPPPRWKRTVAPYPADFDFHELVNQGVEALLEARLPPPLRQKPWTFPLLSLAEELGLWLRVRRDRKALRPEPIARDALVSSTNMSCCWSMSFAATGDGLHHITAAAVDCI